MLVHDRAEAGLHHDFLGGFADRFERTDPRVHVRHRDDPIEVVVVIRVGVRRQAEFLAPTFGEAAPEKIADRHAIGFFVAQRFVQSRQFAQGVFLARSGSGGLAHSIEHAHGIYFFRGEGDEMVLLTASPARIGSARPLRR